MTRTVIPGPGDRWRSVRVTASVMTLVVLVLGVPLALITIGGGPYLGRGAVPLGHVLPGSHLWDPGSAMRWIASAALVMAWSVWAWLVLCVVVELRAWITGGAAARIPGSRTVQSAVAILVGTTLAVTVGGRGLQVPDHRGSTATATGVPSPSVQVLAERGGRNDMVTIAELATATGGLPASGQHGALAEAVAADLVGSVAERPASVAVRWSPTDRPVLPGSQASEPAEPPTVSGSVPRTHLVRARETLWSIAEDELGTTLRWQELAQLNYGVAQEGGGALDEGHWVTPGWRLLLPSPDTAPRPVLPWSAHRSRTPLGAVPGEKSGPGPGSAPAPRQPPAPVRVPAAPVIPLGAGVVGAGVVRLIDRMRRVQQRHRSEGGYIKLPHGPRSSIEWRLRVGDGSALTQDADQAVRLATESWFPSRREAQIVGLRVHAEVIELVLASEEEAILVDRSTLVRRESVPRSDPGCSSTAPPEALAPMMVAVGRGLTGTVLLNLEAVGSLVVSGNSAEADAVVQALALSSPPRTGPGSSPWWSSGSAPSGSVSRASSHSLTYPIWSITSVAGDCWLPKHCRLPATRRLPRLGRSSPRTSGLHWL